MPADRRERGRRRAAARELGYPVVLKAAKRGIEHKSDMQGMRLSLADKMAVTTA